MARRVPVRGATLLISALIAIGCGGGHPLEAGAAGTAAAGAPGGAGASGGGAGSAGAGPGAKDPAVDASAGAAAEVGVGPNETPDTGAAGSAPPPSVALQSCDELAAGGVPDALGSLTWSTEKLDAPCATYRCYDFVTIGSGCDLEIGVMSYPPPPSTHHQMPQGECETARAWASNLQFLGVLRTGFGCEGGQRSETFSYELTAYTPYGASAYRETNFCPEPKIEAVRACLRDLVARFSAAGAI